MTTSAPSRERRRARVRVLALAASGAAFVGATGLHAQHPLAALPFDDPAYEQLQGLERSGCEAGRVSAYRPYLVRDIRASLTVAATDAGCSGPLLVALQTRFARDTFDIFADSEGTLYAGAAASARAVHLSGGEFRPLWRGARSAGEGDPPFSGALRARLTWGASRLLAVTEGVAFSHRRNEPANRQRALRNTGGSVDFGESYLSGQLGEHVTLSLGRMPEAWLGSGRESLLLAAHGPALDRFLIAGIWRRVEVRAVLASLNQVELTPELDSIPQGTGSRFYRYLVAHALTVRPTGAIEVTVGESALLARGTRTLDMAYANPVMLYVVTQNDSSRSGADASDNIQMFGALRLRSGGTVFRGELLVDDIQIDSKDRARIQDQLAWSVTATQALPLLWRSSALAEYRKVNSYTYLRRSYAGAYHLHDQPLGSELGPDADLWRVGAESWPTGGLRIGGGVSGWRQGALRIDQRPGRDVNETRGQPFPTVSAGRPAAQRALLADGGLSYLRHPLTLDTRVEAARLTNPRNELASAATYVRASVTARYAFRIP